MRFIDIRGNLRVPVSNEEGLVVEQIRRNGSPLPRGKLNIRERELARLLVQKGVLDRVMIDEKIHFIYNDLDDLWR